jgi:hypothetical protein
MDSMITILLVIRQSPAFQAMIVFVLNSGEKK